MTAATATLSASVNDAEQEESQHVGIEDMITLRNLNEESIMENLRERYNQKLVYTYTGTILVAMNPFARLKIYDNTTLRTYIGKRIKDMPPHIFAIAEAAYTNVKTTHVNQSVIISGESGAGKSESTKLILQYLASVTSSHSADSWIEQQVLEANTVLESFGNSKTIRNNNSSRFGKFIQVNLNKNSQIIGASIVNYLLEKSRVARQAEFERSYHVFYEMLKGASEDEKQRWDLANPEDYEYLNKTGCIDIEGVNDRKHFEGLKLAMTVLKMTSEDLDSIFQTVSAILWMGNIKFQNNDQTESVTVANPEMVEKVANILGVDAKLLDEALRFKKLTIRGETSNVWIKPANAPDNRDSIAKAIYDNLFQRIVDFINKSLASKEKPANFIGVLDIFGFEAFKVNSFEQFCINYTNEKLQQFFNQFIFKLEQEEYEKEDIKWDKIDFTDNQVCLDLIEIKPIGLLSLLDEETKFPKGTDESWLVKMESSFAGKHGYYLKPRMDKGLFGVKHYAGDVYYTIDGFLEKNKDSIQEEVVELVRNSRIPWVASIFSASVNNKSELPEITPRAGSSNSSLTAATNSASSTMSSATSSKSTIKGGPAPAAGGKATACTYFRNQLITLVSTLASTTPHYVRCIKPNTQKEAFLFEEDMVLSQLRYSGMLDTIRIRKAGFPRRLPYSTFMETYKFLAPNEMKSPGKFEDREICFKTLERTGIKRELWDVGKTKLFLKDEAEHFIQVFAESFLRTNATTIQKMYRGYSCVKKYKQMKASAAIVQKYVRGYLGWLKYRRTRRAIIKMQAVARGWFARDLYRQMKEEKRRRLASIKLQAFFRGEIARALARKMRKHRHDSATKIQCATRRLIARKQLKALKEDKKRQVAAATRIQKLQRGRLGRKRFQRFKQIDEDKRRAQKQRELEAEARRIQQEQELASAADAKEADRIRQLQQQERDAAEAAEKLRIEQEMAEAKFQEELEKERLRLKKVQEERAAAEEAAAAAKALELAIEKERQIELAKVEAAAKALELEIVNERQVELAKAEEAAVMDLEIAIVKERQTKAEAAVSVASAMSIPESSRLTDLESSLKRKLKTESSVNFLEKFDNLMGKSTSVHEKDGLQKLAENLNSEIEDLFASNDSMEDSNDKRNGTIEIGKKLVSSVRSTATTITSITSKELVSSIDDIISNVSPGSNRSRSNTSGSSPSRANTTNRNRSQSKISDCGDSAVSTKAASKSKPIVHFDPNAKEDGLEELTKILFSNSKGSGLSALAAGSDNASKRKTMSANPLLKKTPLAPSSTKDISMKRYLDEQFNYNTKEWSMQSYGQRYFDIPKDYEGSIEALIEEMIRYSKLPIKQSHTKLPPQEKYQKLAVECFEAILKVQDPLIKSMATVYPHMQKIITIGLENPEMRDEILFQLSKQVFMPMDEVPVGWDIILHNGWLLIVLATAAFRPSKAFVKYFQAFLLNTADQYKFAPDITIKKFALQSEENLKNSAMNGIRKFPPSIKEIRAIEDKKSINIKFHFMGGHSKQFEIGAGTTAAAVLKELLSHAEIKEINGWALYRSYTDRPDRYIKGSDIILDTLAENEITQIKEAAEEAAALAAATNAVPSNATSSFWPFSTAAKITPSISTLENIKDLRIVIRKRVFKNPMEDIIDPVEYNLLYNQSIEDATIKDLYSVTQYECIELAALRAQGFFGDDDKETVEKTIRKDLASWIPARLATPDSYDFLVESIVDEYTRLEGTSIAKAKVQYLESIRKFALYGSAIFPVKYRGFWANSENVTIAVSYRGVQFLHSRTKTVIAFFSYDSILSYTFEDGNVFTLKASVKLEDDTMESIENEETYHFVTEQAEEIVSLIREYYPIITFKLKDKSAPEVNHKALLKDILKTRRALENSSLLRKPGPTGQSPSKIHGPTPATLAKSLDRPKSKPKGPRRIISFKGDKRERSGSSELLTDMKITDMATDSSIDSQYSLADWSFSRNLLHAPLTVFENLENNYWSINLNAFILNYGGVISTSKPDPMDPPHIPYASKIQSIIDDCLQYPELVNEVYLQLIKATTEHPDPDSRPILQLWKLMSVFTGCLLPDGEVLSYLRSHLRLYANPDSKAKSPRKQEAFYAKYCAKHIQNFIGTRKCSPSVEEILSSTKCASMRIRFHLLDGQFIAMPADSYTTVGEVFNDLADRLEIGKDQGFVLYEYFGGLERGLSHTEKFSDIVAKWEKFQKDNAFDRSLRKEQVRFLIKKRLYLNTGGLTAKGKSEKEEMLLRAQAVWEIKHDLYPLTDSQAVYLTALLIHSVCGKRGGGGASDEPINIEMYVQESMPKRLSIKPGILEQVQKRYQGILHFTTEEADNAFMEIVRSWTLHGSAVFEVNQSYSNELPSSCWMAVNSEGVHILPKRGKDPILTHPYANILSFVPSPTGILLLTDSQDEGAKYVFSTPQGPLICHLMKDYVERLLRRSSK